MPKQQLMNEASNAIHYKPKSINLLAIQAMLRKQVAKLPSKHTKKRGGFLINTAHSNITLVPCLEVDLAFYVFALFMEEKNDRNPSNF